MKEDITLINKLFSIIVEIDNIEDCRRFFGDLCTFKELEQMAQRIKAAEMLIEGNTYAQVIATTDISSATLSRVSKCIQHGTGGYEKQLMKKI